MLETPGQSEEAQLLASRAPLLASDEGALHWLLQRALEHLQSVDTVNDDWWQGVLVEIIKILPNEVERSLDGKSACGILIKFSRVMFAMLASPDLKPGFRSARLEEVSKRIADDGKDLNPWLFAGTRGEMGENQRRDGSYLLNLLSQQQQDDRFVDLLR